MDMVLVLSIARAVTLAAAALCALALVLNLWTHYVQSGVRIEETVVDRWVDRQLTQLGLNVNPVTAKWVILGGVALTAFVLYAFGFPVTSAVAMVATLLAIAVLLLRIRAMRKAKSFSAQLSEALPIVAASLKSGITLTAALDSYCENADEPIRSEFRRVSNDVIVGFSFPDAVRALAARMHSKDAMLLATTVAIASETGAPVAETIEQIAGTIKERERLRARAASLTATNRASTKILIAVPLLLLAGFCYSSESCREFYFGSTAGIGVLVYVALTLSIGALILNRMTDLKVD